MRPFGRGRELAPGVRVLALIARSRHLDVYDAWDERRACRVAVKVLRPDRLDDRPRRAALLREGRLLRRLRHPHLVAALDVVDGERPAVVLECLGGETLAAMLERRGALGWRELCVLGHQVGSAVGWLHRHGLVHLDLKPANVVADAGRAKVLDLSVARRAGRMRAGTGTWCNQAPEQARGGTVGPPADVWGLGTVLWEAATGENPVEAIEDEHDLDVEDPQLHAPVPALFARADVPSALARLVDATLAADPADRPALDDVLGELAALGGAPTP